MKVTLEMTADDLKGNVDAETLADLFSEEGGSGLLEDVLQRVIENYNNKLVSRDHDIATLQRRMVLWWTHPDCAGIPHETLNGTFMGFMTQMKEVLKK